MEINPELIQKVFEHNCTPEERSAVLHYLSQHPEEVQRLLPYSEWEEIKDDGPLPGDQSEQLLRSLRRRLFPPYRKMIWRAAAVLVPLAGVLIFLYMQPHKTPALMAGVKRPLKDTNWVYNENLSNKTSTVHLPDGSLVKLEKSAFIRYSSSYNANKRDVYLEGQAYFDVAKQNGRPFTVWTGAIHTTVLGTTFRVNAGARSISVKLLTGKVVVSGPRSWKKDIYLLPGEQLSYNRISEQVSVSKIQLAPLPVLQTITEDSVLHFNKASLQEVMDKLSDVYHCKIEYNHRALSGMNFTGTVSHADSLSVILRIIANMNDLELKRSDSTFSLSKTK